MSESVDVVVIGGGPAGACAAALLAEYGRRVVLFEKQPFPRYHIGESLIPYTWYALERLGLLDQMDSAGYVQKFSVQFAGLSGRCSKPFYFEESLHHQASQTWQVERDDFDSMILRRACQLGVEVREGASAVDLLCENDRVVGVAWRHGEARGETRARLVIDASGRDGLARSRFGWMARDPVLDRLAMWTYVQGALRDPGRDAGATTVAMLPDKGWFWYIPQRRDIVSVGLVARAGYLYREGRDLEEIWRRETRVNPWIESHLAGGQVIAPVRVTAEYSYRSRHFGCDGLVLCGDALAFLDPVFSSGLLFALQAGTMVADAAQLALAKEQPRATDFLEYGERLGWGIDNMRKLVCAFYHPDFRMSRMFSSHPAMSEEVTQCLTGNVFRDYSCLHQAIQEQVAVEPNGGPFLPASLVTTGAGLPDGK